MTQRRLSADLRTLPNFLVIGAQRSGTSSLYHWIVQHPSVLRSKRKEVHFFDFNVERGEQWYRAHFPLQLTMQRAGRKRPATTGEATPNYLFDPAVPARVHALLPHVRLIAVLRNPVDRAISHYRHAVSEGREHLSLPDAIDAEDERMALGGEAAWAFSYVTRGHYARQLRHWLTCFDEEQLLILLSDDLFRDPRTVVSSTFQFLGVEPRPVSLDLTARNETEEPRAAVPTGVRGLLASKFTESNSELAELLRRRIDWT